MNSDQYRATVADLIDRTSRVAQGWYVLNKAFGGECWRTLIRPCCLNIACPCHCVLGQLSRAGVEGGEFIDMAEPLWRSEGSPLTLVEWCRENGFLGRSAEDAQALTDEWAALLTGQPTALDRIIDAVWAA